MPQVCKIILKSAINFIILFSQTYLLRRKFLMWHFTKKFLCSLLKIRALKVRGFFLWNSIHRKWNFTGNFPQNFKVTTDSQLNLLKMPVHNLNSGIAEMVRIPAMHISIGKIDAFCNYVYTISSIYQNVGLPCSMYLSC